MEIIFLRLQAIFVCQGKDDYDSLNIAAHI